MMVLEASCCLWCARVQSIFPCLTNCSTSPGLVDGIHERKSMRESMKTRWCLNHGFRMMHQLSKNHRVQPKNSQTPSSVWQQPLPILTNAKMHQQRSRSELEDRLRFSYTPGGCSVDMHGIYAYMNHTCLCGVGGGWVAQCGNSW